ncbi:hypothetical protein CANCADRAFT_147326 [Tortispora caseinolytica NRRL Y-17796]|uniref:Aldehyde dehydrogenase domain-containing protein n=1 Tax=Tortispora caseinolytica NRRL Y-17796 TaxID=767744 RepID=A0A1E4TIW7_9ASCO|nr:hypothetical protein CANCADRAFT_147326 [Tortispora caseinolytica NRRL Y-17796]
MIFFTLIAAVLAAFYLYRYLTNPYIPRIKVAVPPETETGWKSNGKPSPDADTIVCKCPATGQFLDQYASMTGKEIDNAVKRASEAQVTWAKTSLDERRQVLNTLRQCILDNQEEIARIACRDSGKTMLDAAMGEIMVTLEKLNWVCLHGEKSIRKSTRPGSSNVFMKYKSAYVIYEPLGVVSALVSWNYPLHNFIGPVIAALFTGNAIVVKCSEQVVWSSKKFLQIVHDSLRLNGFDENVVQLVYCLPEHADELTTHPGISHITFIGSRPVAHKVVAAAAKTLVPVVVELGGKDPLIALDSYTDINSLSSIILRGTFQSSGQNCIGLERIIAQPKIYELLKKNLSERVPKLRVGAPLDEQNIDMGATITDISSRIDPLIADAVAKGATLVCGGKTYVHPLYPGGTYYSPTLLTEVTKDMKIAQTEVFGPVLTLMKAESGDEIEEIANSTEYALGAAIYGTSSDPILKRLVSNVKAGNIAVNDFATFYVCQLPFGGCKGSGYGRFGGEEGLVGLCNIKSVCTDAYPFISTKIPKPLDYPIPNIPKAWDLVTAINMGYSNFRDICVALFTLARKMS